MIMLSGTTKVKLSDMRKSVTTVPCALAMALFTSSGTFRTGLSPNNIEGESKILDENIHYGIVIKTKEYCLLYVYGLVHEC